MRERTARLFFCVLLAAAAVWAQSFVGSISGTVLDSTGGAVVQAKVVLTGIGNGVQHETVSAASGDYQFEDLVPGTYTVSVTVQGFKAVKSGEIVLTGHQAARFDARLEVGAVTESVMVVAAAPTVNTENGEVAGLESRDDLINAPINQRSTISLFFVNSYNYQGVGSSYSMGGLRGINTNYTIDGTTSNSNAFGNQAGPQTEASLEGLADMKFMVSNNSAEFAKVATVFIESRGGANQVHGSLFYNQVNGYLNARNPFSATPSPPKPQEHDLGGSFGGPVYVPHLYNGRNKTFFYFSFEQNRFPGASLASSNVPTVAMRGGDFSALLPGKVVKDPTTGIPFPNNVIPGARLATPASQVALAMQTFGYPLPNAGSANSPTNNYQFLQSTPDWNNRFSARGDQQIGDNDRLSLRATIRNASDAQGLYDTNLPAFIHYQYRRNINAYASAIHIFSASLVNEFRVGFSRDHSSLWGKDKGGALLQQFGILGNSPNSVTGVPQLKLSNFTTWNEYPDYMWTSQAIQVIDNVSWARGKHALRMGLWYQRNDPNIANGNNSTCDFGCYTFDGSFSGYDYADFLLGIPSTTTRTHRPPNSYWRWNDVALYIQDTYKVSSRLTLNLGLRWEYNQPPSDKNNERYTWDPATDGLVVPNQQALALTAAAYPKSIPIAVASAVGYPSALLNSHWHNFSPRVAFAYRLPGARNFVLRGGYGIYYSPLINALLSNYAGGPFGSLENFTNQIQPNGQPLFQFPTPFLSVGTVPAQSVNAFNPNVRTPYTEQWNLTLERELVSQLVARVSYRGFRSVQIPFQADLNIPPAGATAALTNNYAYPNFASVNWLTNGGLQRLSSLDLSLERKFTSGFTFQSQYTYGKNLSDTDDDGETGAPEEPTNRKRDMGNVSFMPRQRMVTQALYELPFGKGKPYAASAGRLLNGAIGGWQLSGVLLEQSGQFLNPTYSGETILNNRNKSGRMDCIGAPGIANQTLSSWYNASAFALPQPGEFGNCQRNVLSGPGMNDVNLGLMKNFNLTEKAHIQIKATATNAFNHPLYSNPTVTASSVNFPNLAGGDRTAVYASGSNFGKITSVLGSGTSNRSSLGAAGFRTINIGARIDF